MVGKKSDAVIAPYPPDRLGVDKMHSGSPDCPVHTRAKKKTKKKRKKTSFKRVCAFQIELEFEQFFEERERPEYLEKTSWSKGENQQQTDMVLTLGLEPGLHRW